MSAITEQELAGLEAFSGDVLRPDDGGYDDARRAYNGLIDKRPALIARCLGEADIADAIALARGSGLEVSVRGGGHSVAGRSSTDGGVMIDLSRMRGIHVDPGAGTARVQPGVSWGELNRETQLHGLAVTGGVISTTGVAGLTLGGGLGWLMPKFGLALDNLLSARVVTADGQIADGERGRERRPLLGTARGRRQLRRRLVLRVPAAPGRADRSRAAWSPIRSTPPRTCSTSTATTSPTRRTSS